MHKLMALVPVGVFGVFGFAIAFRAVPPADIAASLDKISGVLGPGLTGAAVLCVGIVPSWSMLRKFGKPD